MPVQLDLLEPSSGAARGPRWSELPAPVRREVVELFAALLTTSVRPTPTTEEDADESREDSGNASRS